MDRPCLEGATPTRTSGSSIYPAVQNMLLAARALGLGATLTTLYLQFENEAEAALGLPPNVHSYAPLPIGYPMGRFGPVRRVPLPDVVYEDRWGQTYQDVLPTPGRRLGLLSSQACSVRVRVQLRRCASRQIVELRRLFT